MKRPLNKGLSVYVKYDSNKLVGRVKHSLDFSIAFIP